MNRIFFHKFVSEKFSSRHAIGKVSKDFPNRERADLARVVIVLVQVQVQVQVHVVQHPSLDFDVNANLWNRLKVHSTNKTCYYSLFPKRISNSCSSLRSLKFPSFSFFANLFKKKLRVRSKFQRVHILFTLNRFSSRFIFSENIIIYN